MAEINVSRWLLGGVVAGIVIWLLEGVGGLLYMDQAQTSLERLGLSLDMTASQWVQSVLVSPLVRIVAIFFYAVGRPRFGPGPKAAALVGVAMFAGGYVPSLIGYNMLGIFSAGLLVTWAVVGLIEIVIATMAGAWVYREG